jgi:hypothetical protein
MNRLSQKVSEVSQIVAEVAHFRLRWRYLPRFFPFFIQISLFGLNVNINFYQSQTD